LPKERSRSRYDGGAVKQLITCTSAGRYPLTRGKRYELLAHDVEGTGVIVRDDNARRRWLPAYHFDLSGSTVPILTSWRFDDPVRDERNGRDETNNWVDIALKFDDGTQRWCQMMTPDFLKAMVENNPGEPMVYSKHLILVRNLTTETVEQVLCHLEEQNELIAFSLPLNPDEDEE
jgi:hypothetical protein